MKAIILFLAAMLCAAASSPAAPSASPPNILFILSDDHSYPFLSCYGDANVNTPNLDRLAGQGMKFHRFFTAAPQCVPSRAALMTGRSPVAARITRFSSPLAREEVTFPELLREQAGYFVGVCGRSYHLDGSGNRGGEEIPELLRKHGLRTFEQRFDYVRQGSDQAAATQAAEFLDLKPAGKPFCLWVNFSDPHHVWNAPASDTPDPASLKLPAHWPDLPGFRQQLAAYCAEVNRLDRSVQAVLELLENRGLVTNTIVIFCGDNGAALPHGKGSLYDPGCNVPFLVRWPGVVQPGGDSRALISGEDLAPTLLAAAGLPIPSKMTGYSFLPLLRGETLTPRRFVFAERGPHGTVPVTVDMKNNTYDLSRAVRSERYKLIYNCTPWIPYAPVDSAGGPGWKEMTAASANRALSPELSAAYFTHPRPVYELFDLESDPSELRNLSGQPALAAVERELRLALAEKMITDFDYLPLPAMPGGKTNPPPTAIPRPRAAPIKSKDRNQEGRSRSPNIIVILGDDIGFSDIGCYGGEIETPTLDALAAGGLRLSQFYNTARCCPTRASLMTGLHPHQTGVGHMMEDRGREGYRGRLNRRCVTIAEALKPAGYRSYMAGKWHVTPGHNAQALSDTGNWPLQRGFDRFYGTIHGAGSFFDPSSLVRDNRLITMANDPQYQPPEYYYTEAIADHAVKFIRDHARRHPDQPFFLYTAFTAAHWPLHAKESDIAKYKGRYDLGYEPIRAARRAKQQQLGLPVDRWRPIPSAEDWEAVQDKAFESRCMEVYAAQVDSMDQGIGRMVAELKAQGQFERTLIFYLQDNGGCAETMGRGTRPKARPSRETTLPPMGKDDPQYGSVPRQTRDGRPVRQGYGVMPGGPDTYIAYGRGWANVSNTPFREYKHWTHEGGISTPLIVHWPDGIIPERRGQWDSQPGQLIDIMATCLDLAGAEYPARYQGHEIQPLEGVSLRPLFSGKPLQRPNPLVWEHEGNRAIRDGHWKLVAMHDQPWELYHLETDRTEMNNLAGQKEARVAEMRAAWDRWAARAQVLPWSEVQPRPAANRTPPPKAASPEKKLSTTQAAPSSRPNLILILADDLGYETIGANGGASYQTPILDKLAATGARFTHCYVQPLCTPTRVQLMTGRYNIRNYIRFGIMDARESTFANYLKQAGYATAMVGKWQLGRELDLPKKFGFDEHYLWQHLRRPPRYANPGLEVNGVEKDFSNGEYGPELLNSYALDFVTRHKDRPFFLYYPMLLTHDPYQPTPDSPDWDPTAVGERVNIKPRHFAEMVAYMDKMIGRLVDKLDALGIRDRTLLIFVGDNGTGRGVRSKIGDQIVAGGKGTTTEAGMHVPLIASWPGTCPPATVCSDLVDSTDFLPTLLDAAGLQPPMGTTLDGRSFLPQLRGQKGRPRDWIYSWYSPRQKTNLTVREFAFNHHYKLYRSGQFYDLKTDAGEQQSIPVASLQGEAAAAARRLQEALAQFQSARPPELDQMP